jgi:hypothetical protein
MKKIFKIFILNLFPKLKETLDDRDRLYLENIELRERIKILENSHNRLSECLTIKPEKIFQYADKPADFSIKVFDSKTIPGKN